MISFCIKELVVHPNYSHLLEVFHVKQSFALFPIYPVDKAKKVSESVAAADFIETGNNSYRPINIKRTFISAGETPLMRDACPIVRGCILESFWRASIDKLVSSS